MKLFRGAEGSLPLNLDLLDLAFCSAAGSRIVRDANIHSLEITARVEIAWHVPSERPIFHLGVVSCVQFPGLTPVRQHQVEFKTRAAVLGNIPFSNFHN